MADNVNIIVQDTINDIVVNAAVVVETIDINVQAAVDVVDIVANPNNYVVNINRIIGEQVQSDWTQTDNQAPDYIKNKPTIPAAQVNSDWDATSGVAEILNKPTIPTNTSDLVNDGENGVDPFITLADVPVPTNGLPAGGTAGQILTKVDATDYNATWQENYADWTSVVKHTVKNNGLSGTITKGTAVYVTSSNGTNMLVGRASNASEATSSKTMGLMQSDITTTGSNQTGFVITEGLLQGLNTSAATAGDPVWLGVNGALIYGLTNKPYAPAHLVFIGIVTKISAGNGEIFVKVQNGFELKEIHDVDLITTTPINGHLLGFDGTLWVNKTIASWLGYTPENVSNKQNSLALDGTAVKYPTVDAVNNLSFIDKFKRGIQYFTDFENTATSTPNFTQFTSGAGASVLRSVASIPNQTSNQIGFCQYQTGTTATGYATHINEGQVGRQFCFGGGAWVFETFINVEVLSDATNRFRFVTGFGGHPTNASDGNAAIFTYDEGGTQNGTIASPNWQCVTSVSDVRTLTTTTTAVSGNTWTKLRIEVNAAGTSATFYINSTLVATHTTNIPTFISASNNRGFNVKQSILKSIGTTNRSVFCDYLGYENRLTTIR